MKIYLGADHGGFELKELVKQWLSQWGYEYEDLGAYQLDTTDDYPHVSFQVAERVTDTTAGASLGVLLCRSSAGMVIAANKVRGARAVSLTSIEDAQLARSKNDANIAGLGADYLSLDQARAILKSFLGTPFSAATRHVRRLAAISKYETDHLI